ncbi:hypothetical protein EB74_34135 [Mycobacterium sp. SWH-M5]|nr:hypothetical protein EB74_34135 [Mycobacterium sp. SWH-M5]
MRIRSIKPEFWRSEDISAIEEWGTRLLFIGLWSYVDDNGVGLDRVPLIAADLFADDLARDPRETLARVSRGLQQLSAAGRIVRYTLDGRQFLYVNNWEKHQRIDRPNKPRYPLPDPSTCEYMDTRETLASMSRDPRETPSTGTGEQGNRGTGETPQTPHDEPAPPLPATRRTGAEVARARFAAIPTESSPLAKQIARSYSDSLDTPIDAKTLGEISTHLDRCLRAGQTPEAIAAGIQLWGESDSFAPSQIPKYVTKAAAARSRRGVGRPTLKAVATHEVAEQLAAQLEAQQS